MMLNKRENTPIVPREEERKSEQTRIDISVERQERYRFWYYKFGWKSI